MDEKVIQLLKGLTNDMQELKSDMGDMKSEMISVKSDIGNIKSDIGNMKSDIVNLNTGMTSMKKDMHKRFDHVDKLMHGVGEQFERQTSDRIEVENTINLEIKTMKYRIYELENKSIIQENP